MSDVFTKVKRSDVMSRIRSRGNKDTELALAKLLRRNKITGWRRHLEIRGRAVLLRGPNIRAARQHRPTFRVKPDFVFRQVRLALFVDGCFWHGCPKHATKPKNNRAFWQRKLSANKTRDRLVTRALRRANWRVLRIWEHELAKKNEARLVKRIQSVMEFDTSPRPSPQKFAFSRRPSPGLRPPSPAPAGEGHRSRRRG
jgi:DNA mismatch endonuclease (patch repair protein)